MITSMRVLHEAEDVQEAYRLAAQAHGTSCLTCSFRATSRVVQATKLAPRDVAAYLCLGYASLKLGRQAEVMVHTASDISVLPAGQMRRLGPLSRLDNTLSGWLLVKLVDGMSVLRMFRLFPSARQRSYSQMPWMSHPWLPWSWTEHPMSRARRTTGCLLREASLYRKAGRDQACRIVLVLHNDI